MTRSEKISIGEVSHHKIAGDGRNGVRVRLLTDYLRSNVEGKEMCRWHNIGGKLGK
jgi:hypothetical protein